MTDRIWLHHPDTGGFFHCPAAAVEAWKSRGWAETAAPPEQNSALAEYVPPAAPPDSEPETAEPQTSRSAAKKSTEGGNS